MKWWDKIRKAIQAVDKIKDTAEKYHVPVPIVISAPVDIIAEVTKKKKKKNARN
jgi:malate/lactate dehydrogenase